MGKGGRKQKGAGPFSVGPAEPFTVGSAAPCPVGVIHKEMHSACGCQSVRLTSVFVVILIRVTINVSLNGLSFTGISLATCDCPRVTAL